MKKTGIHQILEEMKNIQNSILNYLDNELNDDENYQNLIQQFNDQKIREDLYKLKSLLHLITKISNNHYRHSNFFIKIEKILRIFANEIKSFYSNTEIFDIFKSNKRLLLFLIKENILIFDKRVFNIITTPKYLKAKYPQYFLPEIKPFLTEKFIQKQTEANNKKKKFLYYYENDDENPTNDWINELLVEIPEDFENNRQIGENNSYISKLIREDSVEEFIQYVNKNCLPLNVEIKCSIFETNQFLLKQEKNPTLIEYSVFFGSIRIFQYLNKPDNEITSSIWPYAIHSNNEEIVSIIENIKEKKDIYQDIFKESIKCHHNAIADYIQQNYLQDDSENLAIYSLKYYNFYFMKENFINESLFYNLCQYDYYLFVDILLKENDIDINAVI